MTDIPALVERLKNAAEERCEALREMGYIPLPVKEQLESEAAAALTELVAEPTDAEEPRWPNWFSCEECMGWHYAPKGRGQVAYDSGRVICETCARLAALEAERDKWEAAWRRCHTSWGSEIYDHACTTTRLAAAEAVVEVTRRFHKAHHTQVDGRFTCGPKCYVRVALDALAAGGTNDG